MLVVVARGVASVLHVVLLVVALLGTLAGDVSFPLFGGDVVDETALRLEVVAHLLRLIRSLAVLEHRFALDGSRGVLHSVGVDNAAVHVHRHDGGSQLDGLVIDFRIAIHAGKAVDGCHDRGVCRRESDRRFEGILLLGSGICLQCVDNQRVEQQRIFRQRQGVCDQRVESRISLGTPTLRVRTLRNERQHHDKQKRYI